MKSTHILPLNVVLCDDDANFMDTLEQHLAKHIDKLGLSLQITKFSRGQELIEADLSNIHIIFLDIRLASENGIEIAQKLVRNPHSCKLIFVTELMTADHRVLEVEAFRYLPKAYIDTLLEPYMKDAIAELGLLRHTVQIKFVASAGIDKEIVYTDDIVYISVSQHVCTLHMRCVNDTMLERRTYYHSLSDLEALLPADAFIKISRQYLVRVDQIQNMSNYQARLKTGEVLKVSEKQYSEIRRRYIGIKGGGGIR